MSYDVVWFLARHGVTNRSEVMGRAGGHGGDRLVELAQGMGADSWFRVPMATAASANGRSAASPGRCFGAERSTG